MVRFIISVTERHLGLCRADAQSGKWLGPGEQASLPFAKACR
jgi:hypothetical protein